VGSKRSWWYARDEVAAFPERYITAIEAASLFGCTGLTVQSRARAAIIPAASGPGIEGCHSYRFEKVKLPQWRQEHMSYQEARQWLGRSKATLHRWIQQGQLTPLPDSRGKSHWFARSAVTQLARVHTAGLSCGLECWYLPHRSGLVSANNKSRRVRMVPCEHVALVQ
jgi:hypothetical protein